MFDRKKYSEDYRKSHLDNRRKGYRKAWLKATYNITEEQYKEMYDKQKGLCAICGKTQPVFHIDHCHKTDKIRGLLCTKCNHGLGQFNDDIEILNSAINYLKGV